jgi:hypothetical protein
MCDELGADCPVCHGTGLRDPERIEPGYSPLPYDHTARSHETWPA